MPVHIFFGVGGGGGENSEKRFKSCSQEQQSCMCTYYKTLKMTVQENISANPCSDFPMK